MQPGIRSRRRERQAGRALFRPFARRACGDRLLRTVAFTTVCVLLSACGHTVATGMTPPAGVVALGAVAASGLIAPVAGRRKSVAFSAALLSLLQIGLHTFFTVTMPSAAAAHMPMDAAAHAAMPMPSAGLAALIPTLPMLCGHIVAAACAAWVLRSGDAAVGRICALAGPCLSSAALALIRTLSCRVRPRPCCLGAVARLLCCAPCWRDPDPTGWTSVALAHAVTRRGPPAGVAVTV
ncbi:hypothetical protein [Streptomyces sp. NBC_00154]|uniref:hypothetical protein n=1 Tax=Streptomyces sp. NBC_00154 TaxID=2975670 RepID=UPI00225B0117|nr:hypothetical protein [Streptomyces sp. NBC_00154]MCX5316141.1 hypothetical protein [Streptomyces sp. NBC_00154]